LTHQPALDAADVDPGAIGGTEDEHAGGDHQGELGNNDDDDVPQ